MFNFSSKTVVNKEYKLSDFLKQINANKKEVRADAKNVNKIVFQNVISAASINVDEDSKYKNIYVIMMELSEERIPKLFIEALDKTIFFHTYYILKYNNIIATYVAYKEITKQVKVDKYYGHDFGIYENVNLERINSVSDVYKAILNYEIGITPRASETPGEYISRVKQINKLDFQISKTKKAILWETQPKKKFEYNERLRRYKAELNELTRED